MPSQLRCLDHCVPGASLVFVLDRPSAFTELRLWGGRACALSRCHVPLFATSWTVAHQVPLSMGFSRQECWSGLPFPSPGDLPHPGVELMSPALAGSFFTT